MNKVLITALISLATLASCGRIDRDALMGHRVAFDGQYFRASVERNRDDISALQVTVRPVSRSVLGATQAGEYEAYQHCIKYFGNSRIDWEHGPDAELGDLLIVDDVLTLIGRCEGERS